MTDDQKARLRAVQQRQREAHRMMFDLQGEAISGLRAALEANSRTHDEMIKLFAADNQADDIIDRAE